MFADILDECLFSYEQSTRHDLYVPRFEAELVQFCEKLVSFYMIIFQRTHDSQFDYCNYLKQPDIESLADDLECVNDW